MSQSILLRLTLCGCLYFNFKKSIAHHHICDAGNHLFTVQFQLTKMQELSGLPTYYSKYVICQNAIKMSRQAPGKIVLLKNVCQINQLWKHLISFT